MRSKALIILFWTFTCCAASAQQSGQRVQIVNSEYLEVKKVDGQRIKFLWGNVIFKQDDILFYCDSANQLPGNVVEAFRNVKITQGDTVTLTGDEMTYWGDVKLAEVRRNVILKDPQMTLYTEKLYFDRNKGLAYYLDSARIVDDENVLTSIKGYYYTTSKDAYFKQKVRLTNPDFRIEGDTLRYNTLSKIAYFYGPTHMYGKKEYLYCESGQHNTKSRISVFGKHSRIESEGQLILGDSLYYDSRNGFGKGYQNTKLIDTAQNLTIKGNYAEYVRSGKRIMVTDSTLVEQVMEDGDTLFIHADTLRSGYDSTGVNRVVKAYYHAASFSKAFQSNSDSMVYHGFDSTIHFHGSPVLWNDDKQISADYIKVKMKDGELHKAYLEKSAFMAARHTSSYFDQVKGNRMECFFRNGELRLVKAEGSCQSVYYILDDDSAYIGPNKIKSAFIDIRLRDRKIQNVNFSSSPKGAMSPINQINPDEFLLKDFNWRDKERPYSILELFSASIRRDKTSEDSE